MSPIHIVRKGRTPKHVGCSVDACKGKHAAKGMCAKHYYQSRRPEGAATVATREYAPAPSQRPAYTPQRSAQPKETRTEREITQAKEREMMQRIEAEHERQRADVLRGMR